MLIRDYLGDGVWLCKLVSLCSGQIVKPAVSHVRSECNSSNIRLAIQHLQQSDMGNQRSLHHWTLSVSYFIAVLEYWRKLLTDLKFYYSVERKAREFQSNHFCLLRECHFPILQSRLLLTCSTKKITLENQRLNAHLNVTENLTRKFQSNHFPRFIANVTFNTSITSITHL